MTIERRKDYPQITERLARIEERQVAIDNRINGSIDDIKEHINASVKWRAYIVGIIVSIVVQAVLFAYTFGNLNKTVSVNERILMRILNTYKNIETTTPNMEEKWT